MKFLRSILTFSLLSLTPAVAQESDALRDLQLGLNGILEASKNPELLAQLMQDLQDPAMMAEAKKMMDDPEYQKQMKKFMDSKDFKENMKKTTKMMQDPSTAARSEAKLEHMLKVGQEKLKQGAAGAMEEAMAAMTDPQVMAEMAQMMKDPKFQERLAAMTKDPSFKNYVAAMEEMMQDPEKKRKMEKVSAEFRKQL